MSKLDQMAEEMAAGRVAVLKAANPAVQLPPAVSEAIDKAAATAVAPKVTASKAKWGSIVPAVLGAATAVPVISAVLPDNVTAQMGFWEYFAWTVLQAALFAGLTFLNIYQAPPNEVIQPSE